MDFQQLEILEDKIKKLVTALKALQGENETLTRKNEEQEKNIRQLKQDLEKWSKSAQENDTLQKQIDGLKKEREQVRQRIEGLVSTLEDLESRL